MMSTKKKEKRLQVTSEKTFHICELTHPAQKQEQEDTHTRLYFMVCLIIQLYLLSHLIKAAVREGMVLMAGFTKRSTELGILMMGSVFIFFLIPVSYRNQLLTDVLQFRAKLLGGWALDCFFKVQQQ